MGKQSDKRAATYGKKSTFSKKKRPLKPVNNGTVSASSSDRVEASEVDPSPATPLQTVARPAAPARVSGASYTYVMADLKKVGVIAVALFVILIVLSFVL